MAGPGTMTHSVGSASFDRSQSFMVVHLVDGTYELFRHFYGQRRFNNGQDKPFGAVVGVLHTVLEMIEGGAAHVGGGHRSRNRVVSQ